MTIINDILEQIENVTVKKNKNDAKSDSNEKRREIEEAVSDIGQANIEVDAIEEGENAEESDELLLQTHETIKEKVIPLYTPEDAVVKVFMIHGSQKSALALASFALGFQQQVIRL